MFVPDLLLARVLQEEWTGLRQSAVMRDDFTDEAEPDVKVELERWLTSPQAGDVLIRPGLPVGPAKVPVITILLAEEGEEPTGIGMAVAEGDEPEARDALLIQYLDALWHEVTGVIDLGILRFEVRDPSDPTTPRLTAQEVAFPLANYATLTDLATAITASAGGGVYQATAVGRYSTRPSVALERQTLRHLEEYTGDGFRIRSDRYAVTRGTSMIASYAMLALSPNANICLWLQTFVKWALLRRRQELEARGLAEQLLSGGDLEPAPELLADFIYARRAVLQARYFARYRLVDTTEIDSVAVTVTTPASYREF